MQRYALQWYKSKTVEMNHNSWLVYGGDESLEPKCFAKCFLANEQMLWLELLRHHILESRKKIVMSYYLHGTCLSAARGIFSFQLSCLRTSSQILPLWLANSCYWSFKTHLKPEVCLETHLHHRASQLLVSIVFRPYFGHLMQRTDAFEKTLMLGKIEDWRRRGQ